MAERKMEFPNNSRGPGKKAAAEVPEKKKLESLVTSEAIVRKPTLWSQITERFSGDDVRSVGGYLLFDVIIPASRNMLFDAINQGSEKMIFGDSRGRFNNIANNINSRTRYQTGARPIGVGNARSNERPYDQYTTNNEFREVIVQNLGEAHMILDALSERCAEYGVATVADLYDLVGRTSGIGEDKYGWHQLEMARVKPIAHGYLLDLPRPTVIE